jgi:hypothetical protein
MPEKKPRTKFPFALVKEYGEQTHRDFLNSKTSHGDAAWSSVYVAWGVGMIEESEHELFRRAITKYADETKFPKGWI